MDRNRKLLVLVFKTTILLAGVVILAAASTNWSAVSSPNLGSDNQLYGSTAVSATDVWAVGYAYTSSGIQSTLVERWNGSKWSIIPSPNPGTSTRCGVGYSGSALTGVAKVSSTNLWAVGYMCGLQSKTLTEQWTGSKWSFVASPNEPGSDASTLVAVAARAPNDAWAVGNYKVANQYQWDTLIEHWNGTKWSIVSSPNVPGASKNFLNAVVALSPMDVWAVGYSEGGTVGATDAPLIEHFDGQSWKIVPSVYPAPSPFNVLYGIAALSPTDIWAVGYANENSQRKNGQALIEHWDGTKWRLVNSPIAGNATLLYSVAAVSSTDIWAVGYIQTSTVQFLPVTEHWNGTAWTVVTPPNPGKVAQLFSVATANGKVWAVGAYSKSQMQFGYMPNPLTFVIQR
jgi:hypothetical protein